MNDSEELEISHKSWKRSMDPIQKEGFREGFEKGRENTFQEGFNIGFKCGFDFAYRKALDCGKTKLEDESYKAALEKIDGECVICSEPEDKIHKMTIKAIIDNQKSKYNELQ